MKKAVIIVAGGTGSRMGSNLPKQFMELGGKPVLMHTIEAFYSYDTEMEIILVLPENQLVKWDELIKQYSFPISHQIVKGGKERFNSVKNGLAIIDESIHLVGIHDGVRPFANLQTIANCFKAAQIHGAAIPVVKVNDSLREINDTTSRSVNRANYCLVQTPQCFKREILINSYDQPYDSGFTDDASVVEAAGFPISLASGNPENIKITNPFDLIVAGAILDKR